MANDLVSRRTRNMLADYLSSNSVLRKIADEFDAAEIPCKPDPNYHGGGQRKSLVHGYYNGLDFSHAKDAKKFLNVLSIFMREMEHEAGTTDYSADHYRDWFLRFDDQLARDGYTYKNSRIVPITASARLSDAKALAESFDAAHIGEQIARIEAAIDSDPALAIGSAKEMTESCFKTILSERTIEYGSNDDLLQLGKKVFKALKLVPDDIDNAAKGAETIKRLLNNLSTVVQGIAEIRGLYGTGHGKEGRAKGVSPRHARLAVGAASALVTFIFQTHLETDMK